MGYSRVTVEEVAFSLIFEIRSGSEACGESRDTDFHGRQDGRFGENEGAHRSPTAVHTGLSQHRESHHVEFKADMVFGSSFDSFPQHT